MIKKILFLQLIYVTSLLAQLDYYDKNTDDNKLISLKNYKPIYLVDLPTANLLTEDRGYDKTPMKFFRLSMRVYDNGGVNGSIMVGITRHLMFGVSYGGQNLIGEGEITWNPAPGLDIRYRLFSETYPFPPAIAIGYSSQGYGAYLTDSHRYEIKSPGLYAVASKNYSNPILNLGFHVGLNYSSENSGGDKDLNFFLGAHFIMEEELSVVWEYDFATNDNDENSVGTGKGYMNVGVRWLFANQLILEFAFKNILKNKKNELGEIIRHPSRELKIIYRQPL